MRLMQKIEQKRGSRVIALIHRQERMSILGIPIARYIDIQDSESPSTSSCTPPAGSCSLPNRSPRHSPNARAR
jgi:hypothetical protein